MKDRIPMIYFVVVLGTLLSAVIMAVNSLTASIIEKNSELTIKRNLLEGQNISFQDNEIEEAFNQNIRVVTKGGKRFYVSKDNDVAFEFNGPGVWGQISGVIAIFGDLKTIKKIKIIHQEETPGLGGRLSEKGYLVNFDNKKLVPKLEIVNRRKAEKENEVDGITGATMTSKAFESLINEQTNQYLAVYRGN